VPIVETETGLDGVRFAVVDLETSGLHPSRHHILQVAVFGVDAWGNELDRWSTYVRPPRWPFARVGPRHIHGIRRRAVAGAPTLADVLPEVAARVAGAVFTAHNAQFDLAFLRHQAARVGVPWPDPPRLCTLTLSRTLDPERAVSHRLGDLCRRYGVPHDDPHDALADAIATGAVLPHLLKDSGITSLAQLGALAQAR
jgi:DNA polymerase-3 subunit epsilon